MLQRGIEQPENVLQALDELSFVIGVTQHHDGISGTEKQAVCDNYAQLLREATEKVDAQVRAVLTQFNQKNALPSENMARALWNASPVSPFEKAQKSYLLNVYNPSFDPEIIVRVNVPQENFQVFEGEAPLDTDVVCLQANQCTLYFKAKVEPHAYAVFSLQVMDGAHNLLKAEAKTFTEQHDQMQHAGLTFARDHEHLLVYKDQAKDTQYFAFGYRFYKSYQGEGQKSGAYIFRAVSNDSEPYAFQSKIEAKFFQGKVVSLALFEDDKIQA